MTRESLSALLDGECSPAETDRLLDQIGRSPELQKEWSRLCLVRDARLGTRISQDQTCICAGVMSALDDMPEAIHPKVVELADRRKSIYLGFSWKPVAGLAAAASVAAAVVLLLAIPAQQSDVEGNNGVWGNQINAPVSAPVIPRPSRGLQSVALHPEEIAQREELDNLLMEHNGSMADQGMGGTLRYARFAAHTAEYRPQQEPVGAQRE